MAFSPTEFASPTQTIGTFHAIEIDALDFERAAVALSQLATYIDNTALPLRAVKKIARDDIKERFDSETAPDGNKWTALDPEYAARKVHDVGFEHPILTRTRKLREAATSEGAWSITGESVFFSTANLPPYWRVHQEGSEGFGERFHAGAVAGGEDHETSEASGDQNIPPRPFIGLSAEAEAKILELFDIWFSEGLENATRSYAISSVGTLHVRTPSGRFGEKIEF